MSKQQNHQHGDDERQTESKKVARVLTGEEGPGGSYTDSGGESRVLPHQGGAGWAGGEIGSTQGFVGSKRWREWLNAGRRHLDATRGKGAGRGSRECGARLSGRRRKLLTRLGGLGLGAAGLRGSWAEKLGKGSGLRRDSVQWR